MSPEALQLEPPSQGVQLVTFCWPEMAPYEPAGQGVANEAPPGQKPPCGQMSGVTVPLEAQSWRGGHGTQDPAPGEGWYVPGAHCVGSVAPASA